MFQDHLIPLADGEAISRGWTAGTGFRPAGVTWHWTAVPTLEETRALIGPGGSRRGQASAHFCVGRTAAEGIDRYVTLAHRSWHCGQRQTLDWLGRASTDATKGARTTIGVETVHVGYAREGFPAASDWRVVAAPDGRVLRVAPWGEEQLELMVALGRWIVARCPWIRPEHHHGHHDLCPGHKADVAGFPFAELLRRIYDDPSIEDVWTPFDTLEGRRRALADLGHTPGDGEVWTPRDEGALRALQAEAGLVEDGRWTVWVSRAVAGRVPEPA